MSPLGHVAKGGTLGYVRLCMLRAVHYGTLGYVVKGGTLGYVRVCCYGRYIRVR